jgi:hypothetical protein
MTLSNQLSLTLISSLSIATACGGGSSTSPTNSTEVGGRGSGIGGAPSGGTAGDTNASPATGGATATTSAAGAANSGSFLTVGQACSPIGTLGCADKSQVVSCPASGVWTVRDTCATGTQCDPKTVTSTGKCSTTPVSDPICDGKTGRFCADGHQYECDASGSVISRSICPSHVCDGTACKAWDACNAFLEDRAATTPVINDWCMVACTNVAISDTRCGIAQQFATDGVSPYANFFAQDNTASGPWDVAVPAAANWPKAANCPDVRAYMVALRGTAPVRFEVPEPYWVVSSPVDWALTNDKVFAAAANHACDGTPIAMPVVFDLNWTAANPVIIIATRDPTAPAFWLSIEQLWGQ